LYCEYLNSTLNLIAHILIFLLIIVIAQVCFEIVNLIEVVFIKSPKKIKKTIHPLSSL